MDRPTFVQLLRRSRLLPDTVIDQTVAALPEDDPTALAKRLVDDQFLTKYQASQLLRGRSRGFQLGLYRITEPLGRGGMGAVFKAVHTSMNRTVAIKVLNPRDVDPVDLQLFQREIRAAAQLHHPNIVTAFDASETKGLSYLVMEHVDGPNLERLVRLFNGPLPVPLASGLMRQAAQALAYAHSRGVIHRDIKPANLLVGGIRRTDTAHRKPTLKILDFGLARLQPQTAIGATDATIAINPGAVFGTPDYISPEQAQDIHAVDERSDVYSLGCTFYFALAGTPPFDGQTSFEKLVKHLTATPQSLTSIRNDVPPPLAAIVAKCMAKDPADRFHSAQELADALAPFDELALGLGYSTDTLASTAVKTPAGSDPEFGTGWTFEMPDSRSQIALPPLAGLINPPATPSPEAPSAPEHDRLAYWPRRLPLALALCGAAAVGGAIALAVWLLR